MQPRFWDVHRTTRPPRLRKGQLSYKVRAMPRLLAEGEFDKFGSFFDEIRSDITVIIGWAERTRPSGRRPLRALRAFTQREKPKQSDASPGEKIRALESLSHDVLPRTACAYQRFASMPSVDGSANSCLGRRFMQGEVCAAP